MDLESKIIQGISKRLFHRFGLVIPTNQILSLHRNRISEEVYEKILSLRRYFEEMADIVTMTDEQLGPNGIMRQLTAYAHQHGTIIRKRVATKDPRTGEEKVEEIFDRYVPNDPNEYVIILTDHLAELNTDGHKNLKDAIEDHSDNMRIVRNRYGYIPVDIQQQSSAQESLDHFKSNKLEPSAEGLGESKLTQRKVNVMLGLFNPVVHEIKTYRGYDITKLGDNYRNLSIIRNRNGTAGGNIGLYFNGAVNYFEELPKAEDIKDNIAAYEVYQKGQVGPLAPKKQFIMKF